VLSRQLAAVTAVAVDVVPAPGWWCCAVHSCVMTQYSLLCISALSKMLQAVPTILRQVVHSRCTCWWYWHALQGISSLAGCTRQAESWMFVLAYSLKRLHPLLVCPLIRSECVCICFIVVLQLWCCAVGDVHRALTLPGHVSQPGAAQRQHWQGAGAA
jgi:hypothetical protein